MPESLFSAFAPNTYQEWLDKVGKDLRGKPIESLDSFTSDGFRIHPLFSSDFPNQPISEQPISEQPAWTIVEEFIVSNEQETNKIALDKLNRGATGLLFYVYEDVNLEFLLKDILIEHITIHFVVEGNANDVLAKWKDLIQNRGLRLEDIKGSINVDPIENAARTGFWQRDSESDLMALGEIVEDAPKNIKTLCVNANLYGNAGATPAQQIGFALAHSYEYINRFGKDYAGHVWLNLSIGGQYFEEIAKFRAMRRVWHFLLKQIEAENTPLHIYAESGFRNKTIFDPWVNMLRSTTQGMSAAIGGADEILLRPFNITYKVPQEFGNRIARNQQLILANESYFDKVSDPSAGSYFIENLTEELANKAWQVFQDIERNDGFIKCLEAGYIQNLIEKSAEIEEMRFNAGKLPLLGSNLFPNAAEQMKSEIEEPLFSQIPEGTDIKPIVAKRLSEEYEKERLEKENDQ